MKLHIGYLLAFSAIVLAVCGAFFSVYGLAHMFAGASLSIIIMASSLEFSKLVIATYLHSYWDKMNKIIKIYLTSGLVILALITSLGIYGYLSNAYQITANKLEVMDANLSFKDNDIKHLENLININNKQNERFNNDLDRNNDKINNLYVSLDNQESRLSELNTRNNRESVKTTRESINKLEEQNKSLQINRDLLTSKNDSLFKVISNIKLETLNINTNSDVSGEVTTLKYMANITGMSMGSIINIFILLIIFVFDPLAICLVIATSDVFERNRKPKLEEKSEEFIHINEDYGLEDKTETVEVSETNEIVVNNTDKELGIKPKEKRGFSLTIPKEE